MQKNAVFPGRFESLEKISVFVKAAASAAGLDEYATYAVELAVDEACSNIIEHAYGAEDRGEIECDCIVLSDGLKIILRDTGAPFDPDAVPDMDPSVPLEDRDPGGAGVFLMHKVMDSVEYRFTLKGNILTMVKHK